MTDYRKLFNEKWGSARAVFQGVTRDSQGLPDVDAYPNTLEELPYGVPFEMLNYAGGVYIRVRADDHMLTQRPSRFANPLPFNDDGHHLPIVCLTDETQGFLFWMSKNKPVRIVEDFYATRSHHPVQARRPRRYRPPTCRGVWTSEPE